MFRKAGVDGYREVLEGVRLKTMAHGERTLLGEFRLGKGATVPAHNHPHEQTGYLVSGRLSFIIDGGEQVAEAGDAWCIAGGVEHAAEALEDSVVVEVFSPVREEYLP